MSESGATRAVDGGLITTGIPSSANQIVAGMVKRVHMLWRIPCGASRRVAWRGQQIRSVCGKTPPLIGGKRILSPAPTKHVLGVGGSISYFHIQAVGLSKHRALPAGSWLQIVCLWRGDQTAGINIYRLSQEPEGCAANEQHSDTGNEK